MYLKRKIDEYLLEWKKNEERLPLIIKGARQVGKTESINHFAEQNYSNIVSINFVLEPKYKTILSDGYAVEDIIKNISMIDTSKRFIAGDTVIIFDELQEFPDIATALKSFRIDGRFDVICSGSLLGIHYRKIHSNSVGYKTDYEMFSMDFEEFLWAKGYSEKHIEDILKHMQTGTPFSETELSVYKKLFLEYCVLGGMPAVVKVYIEKNLFTDTLEIQRQIQMDYEEDIRKYAEGLDQTKIVSVYRNVPVQLAKENKKFQLSKIDKKARSREYMGCITWLEDAGVISICYCLNYPELPLILMGHSMGSLAVRAFVAEHDSCVDMLIVCGSPSYNTAMPLGVAIAKTEKAVFGPRHRSKLIETMSFGAGAMKFRKDKRCTAWICSDPDVAKEYEESELCGFTFTDDAYLALFELMKRAYDVEHFSCTNPDMPVLFVSGAEDPCLINVRHFAKTVRAMRRAGYKDVKGKLYPGMRHEILNEIGREQVYHDIAVYMRKKGF